MKTLIVVLWCLLGSVGVAVALDATLPTTYTCTEPVFGQACTCYQGGAIVSCLPSVNGNGDNFIEVPLADKHLQWKLVDEDYRAIITITNYDDCRTGEVKCFIYVDPELGLILEERP